MMEDNNKVYIVVGQDRREEINLAVFADEKKAEEYADDAREDYMYGARVDEHEVE
jgi:hypothetical protein